MNNVLSVFDGMSCGQIALNRAGIKYSKYYASEIDKYAIQITQKNYPDTIQLGSVKEWRSWDLPEVDIVMGGSPCQDLLVAKNDRKGLQGERSSLFYEFVDIVRHFRPMYFLLENVASMPKEAMHLITRELFGVQPMLLNSSLVSAQNRKRLYWVGKREGDVYIIVHIFPPDDKGLVLKDIIEPDVDAKYYLTPEQHEKMTWKKGAKTFASGKREGAVEYPMGTNRKALTILQSEGGINRTSNVIKQYCDMVGFTGKERQGNRVYNVNGKAAALPGRVGALGMVAKPGLCVVSLDLYNGGMPIPYFKSKCLGTSSDVHSKLWQAISNGPWVRKLTPLECERLQTVPDGYTEGVSNAQRYRMLGNGWTVDIISHIFSNLKGLYKEVEGDKDNSKNNIPQ